MITLKQILNSKDKEKLNELLDELIDVYGDFYVTKANIRLFLRENKHLLFSGLSKGDKVVFSDNAVGYIYGFADNAKRKYIKFLYKKPKDVTKLLTVISWNLNIPLWAKVKEENPIKKILLKNGFKIKAGRGKEILLYRPSKKLTRGK